MLKKIGFITFLIGFVSQAREPRTYSYLAKNIPIEQGENCHSQAKKLAERFSKITNLPASGTCKSIETQGHDVLIQYQALEPITVASSVSSLDFPSQGYEFSSQAECEGQISAEKDVYLKMMGAEPLLAFCQWRDNYYGLRRWALILEGFSESQIRPVWSSSFVTGSPTREQISQLRSSVKESFTKDGVNVRFVFVQPDDKGQLRVNVFYYGRYNEQIKGFSLAAVDSLDSCSQSFQDLKTAQEKVPQFSTVAQCLNNPYRRGADLFVVVNVLNWFGIQKSAESFPSHSQCSLEKNRLVAFYQKEVSADILEGFCTEWGSNWKISLLRLPR